jgi:hypothetical protein
MLKVVTRRQMDSLQLTGEDWGNCARDDRIDPLVTPVAGQPGASLVMQLTADGSIHGTGFKTNFACATACTVAANGNVCQNNGTVSGTLEVGNSYSRSPLARATRMDSFL